MTDDPQSTRFIAGSILAPCEICQVSMTIQTRIPSGLFSSDLVQKHLRLPIVNQDVQAFFAALPLGQTFDICFAPHETTSGKDDRQAATNKQPIAIGTDRFNDLAAFASLIEENNGVVPALVTATWDINGSRYEGTMHLVAIGIENGGNIT